VALFYNGAEGQFHNRSTLFPLEENSRDVNTPFLPSCPGLSELEGAAAQTFQRLVSPERAENNKLAVAAFDAG
jgi:hypothetical protein